MRLAQSMKERKLSRNCIGCWCMSGLMFCDKIAACFEKLHLVDSWIDRFRILLPGRKRNGRARLAKQRSEVVPRGQGRDSGSDDKFRIGHMRWCEEFEEAQEEKSMFRIFQSRIWSGRTSSPISGRKPGW